MDYLLTSLLSFVLLYKYVAIFVIVFLSGLILPLPSNTLLLAAGAFASQGYMSAGWVFAVALISNVLGDSLGWALTRFWGTRFVTREHIRRFKAVAKTEQFVREHVRMAIIVTRFIGTPGSIVNFLCGLSGVPYRRFVIYDIIGNATDTAFFVVLGYALGNFSENFSNIAQLTGWIVLVVLLIFTVVGVFWKRKNT
jgi:membrane protein DedA with SNARE-associated domain